MTIIDFPTKPTTPTRVEVPERFDAHQTESFTAHVGTISGDLVLDLGGVRFVDAAGLHALVEARANTLEHGHDLVVQGLSQTARIIFELAGLEEALPLATTPQAA